MDTIKIGRYYYLGNSFRVKDRVVYKEKYLGKNIPVNIKVVREEFLHECLSIGVFKRLDTIKEKYITECDKLPDSIKKNRMIDLSISITYNTNAIEGSKITLEETVEIVRRKISPNRPIDDVKESINHSKLFLKVVDEKENLSIKSILKWHKELFFETKGDIAGNFREYSVKVGDYRAPDWQDVKKLMTEYIRRYSDNKDKMHPVELSARMHYRFEKIHPFGDGNGRVGRLIIAYVLSHARYPLLIIEYKRRKSYYHALEQSEERFLQYVLRRYIKENN
jgi:Fic family protein